MASRGFSVLAGVRREEDAASIRTDSTVQLTPLMLDVVDQASVDAAAELVAETVADAGLAGLVNNAGIVVGGPVETTSIEDFKRQFEVNVWGLLRTTQAFLGLVRKAKGRIVNMGSLAGKVGQPFMAPYCASKHALEAITDALRLELFPAGVHACIVEPGAIATPIWQKGQSTIDSIRSRLSTDTKALYGSAIDKLEHLIQEAAANGIPPERVADAVEHALTATRPRLHYPVGNDAKGALFMKRWLPDRAFDRMILRRIGAR